MHEGICSFDCLIIDICSILVYSKAVFKESINCPFNSKNFATLCCHDSKRIYFNYSFIVKLPTFLTLPLLLAADKRLNCMFHPTKGHPRALFFFFIIHSVAAESQKGSRNGCNPSPS